MGSQGSHRNLPHKKAVVVDDNPQYCDMYSRWLTDCGFTVSVVDNYRSALDLLDREFFHVAMVDRSLRGDEDRLGLTVLSRIRELDEGTEAVFLSAFGDMEDGSLAKERGAFAVRQKESLGIQDLIHLAEDAYLKAQRTVSTYEVGLDFLSRPDLAHLSTIWVSRALEALSAGAFNEVDAFARALLINLVPLCRLTAKPQGEVVRSLKVVKGVFWSKLVAEPILVVLGSPDVVSDPKTLALLTSDGSATFIRESRQGRLAGAVYTLTQPPREAFGRTARKEGSQL